MLKAFYRVIAAIAIVMSLIFIPVSSVSAQRTDNVFDDVCGADVAGDSDFCKNVKEEEGRSLVLGERSLMVTITQIIVYITGAVSVIMIIIGGLRYVASAGDSNGIQGAKNTILYALIGLAVAALAQILVSFVLGRFV